MNERPPDDVESRMGIRSLDELLAEREQLVQEAAPLYARYGGDRAYDILRKIELAKIQQVIRAKAVVDDKKMTEAAIDQAAHCDLRYVEWVTTATVGRERLYVLEDKIQGLTEQVNRGQMLGRFMAAEIALTPR